MGSFVATRENRALTASAAFGLLIIGTAAVVFLPDVAHHIPHPGQLSQAKYALVAAAILVLSAAYIFAIAETTPELDRVWGGWTLVYGAGLATVKFILSPIAFQKESGTTLLAFVIAGLIGMLLYVGALYVIYLIARKAAPSWSMTSKLTYAVVFGAAAVALRVLFATVLGTASQYIHGLGGTGLVLPFVVAIASFSAMQSFDRAGSQRLPALVAGIALVVAQHVLWVVYMNDLFR